jgi:hypothetical protein
MDFLWLSSLIAPYARPSSAAAVFVEIVPIRHHKIQLQADDNPMSRRGSQQIEGLWLSGGLADAGKKLGRYFTC